MPVKSDSPARAAARARFAHFADDQDDASGRLDPDNPAMTDADLARLRPAAEMHPELIAAKRRGGRPKSEARKVAISIRLDPDVVEALRASGEGWQGRTNDILRKGLGLDLPTVR